MVDVMNMRRDGTFIVELCHPLKRLGGELTELVLHPLNFEQSMRWQSGEIESRLALVAVMARVPERLLRLLVYPDPNRVMWAVNYVLPAEVRENFSGANSTRPLTTPDELLPQIAEEQVGDQDDPRFPHVDGPVRKFPTPPQVNMPQRQVDNGSGFNADVPDVMKAVNNV